MKTSNQNEPRNNKEVRTGQPLWQRLILLTVLTYEGLGGLAGGILLILEPGGSYMEMPVEIMHGAFPNFLIPGIILLGMGMLNVLAFFSVLRKRKNDWIMAGMAMGGFIIWFVVEIIILQELHWLHLMWGLPVLMGFMVTIPLIILKNDTPKMIRGLMICGILSSVWYFAINIFVPMHYEGYSQASYTVSELSAIGAPTRLLWVLLVIFYPLLFISFGYGVMKAAEKKSRLRVVGILIIVYCFFNVYWPPMHMRGMEPTLTDVMHIVWASITVLLFMFIMGFGAASYGKQFRIFTIISMILLMIFGSLTGRESPNIPVNGPTPMIGIWERINIGIFLVWVIALAVLILQKEKAVKSSGVSA